MSRFKSSAIGNHIAPHFDPRRHNRSSSAPCRLLRRLWPWRRTTLARTPRVIRTRPAMSRRKNCPTAPSPPPTPTATSSSAPPTPAAPEMTVQAGVPHGVINFTMNSADSKFYPGIARDPGTFGTPDPDDPAKLDRHHQPSRALHAQGRRLRARAIRARHGGALHRRRRRPRPRPLHRPR